MSTPIDFRPGPPPIGQTPAQRAFERQVTLSKLSSGQSCGRSHNGRGAIPPRATGWEQIWLAFRQRAAQTCPTALQERKEGQEQAQNHRAEGSRSESRERPDDAGKVDPHARPVRSRPAGGLQASSLRSQPHRPAKEWAACFPLEPADANDRCDAGIPPPKLSVPRPCFPQIGFPQPRSNSWEARSQSLRASGSLSCELALGKNGADLTAR